MDLIELRKLIEECCDDIFDRNEPLANVKSRLFVTLSKELNKTEYICKDESKTKAIHYLKKGVNVI